MLVQTPEHGSTSPAEALLRAKQQNPNFDMYVWISNNRQVHVDTEAAKRLRHVVVEDDVIIVPHGTVETFADVVRSEGLEAAVQNHPALFSRSADLTAACSTAAAEIGTSLWDDPDAVTTSIYQMLKDMHEVLGQHGVPYVIDGGTLLGAVRHGGMIPHDDDADIEILEEHRERMQTVVFPALETLGYTVKRMWFGYKMFPNNGKRIEGHEHKFPSLDVFFMHFEDGKSRIKDAGKGWDNCAFDESTFRDLKLYTFGPLQLYGPANPFTYLNGCYGGDWNTMWYRQLDHATETRLPPIKTAMEPLDFLPRVPTAPLRNRVAL
jgi:hypothetical protein